jgi:hypothetical protein
VIGRRPRRQGAGGLGPAVPGEHRRRSGPEGEERWWDPRDQAIAEQDLVDRAVLGRGWREVPMLNNAERRDPYGPDPASAEVRRTWLDRRPTALDEGRAWRHRDLRSLLVVRCELFATAGGTAHRAAWSTHGAASLDATWRDRWIERDAAVGWIEAEAVAPSDRPEATPDEVEWFRVQDHTDPSRSGEVTCYEHLTVWVGRALATITVRHALGLDLDDLSARAAAESAARLRSALG